MSHIHGFILLITSLIEEMDRITQLYRSRKPIIKVFYWSRFMSFGKKHGHGNSNYTVPV